MSNRTILNHMIGAVMLSMMFGASAVYAQAAKDASGMTKDSQAGASGGAMNKADQDLMRDLAASNVSEIEAAKLAQSKSQNDQVKNYAQRMIDDHTKAQQELQQLADAKGVKLPTEPDIKHKAAVKALSALSGDNFDKMYMKQGGLNDHRHTHQLLTQIQERAADPALKALAAKMQPTVDQHLTMAKEVGGGQATGSSGTDSKDASGSSDSGEPHK